MYHIIVVNVSPFNPPFSNKEYETLEWLIISKYLQKSKIIKKL